MRFSHIIMMFSKTFLASANRISQRYRSLVVGNIVKEMNKPVMIIHAKLLQVIIPIEFSMSLQLNYKVSFT